MVVSEEVTPRGRVGGSPERSVGGCGEAGWGRRALQRDTGREAQTFTEWVREMGTAGERRCFGQRQEEAKKEVEGASGEGTGTRARGISGSQARKSGALAHGQWGASLRGP